jgi:spore germination protein KC
MRFSGWTKALKGMLLLVYVAAMIPLVGCWDRKEVNDMALVLATGVDKKQNGEIEFSVQIFLPKNEGGGGGGGLSGGGSGGGGGSTFVVSASGHTVGDALSKLRERFPRETFYGHDNVLVIGEEMAKDGVSNIVDILTRFPEARVRLKVFVSQGNAKRILELQPPLEPNTSNVLRRMTDLHTVFGVTIKSLAQMLAGGAGAAALPWTVILPAENGKDELQTLPYLKGTAIFKGDKMIGQIDEDTTKGVLWLRDEIKANEVILIPKGGKGFVSLTIIRSESKLLPQIKDGQWSLTARIFTEARLIENTTKISFKDPKLSKELERDLNEIIEEKARKALDNVQKGMNADIFGFAETFYRKYPKEFGKARNRWDEVFPNIQVRIQVDSKLLSTGLVDTGISRPGDEVKKKG